jgi:outer membrane protein TolC
MSALTWRRWAALLAVTAATPLVAQQPAPQPAPQPAGAVSLSLEDAFRVAEHESEAVRVAEAGVLRARGQQYQARSQYLPQINGSANYQKTLQSQFQAISKLSAPAPDTSTGPKLASLCTPEIPANATPAERQAALQAAQTCSSTGGADLSGISRIFASPYTFTLGLTGSQTLFAGGRIAAANEVANASKRVADIAVTSARAQLRLDVAQAYYNAVLAARVVQISESTLVQAERALRQTSLAQQVGNVAEFDLLRAQVTRDNQRPVLIQARSQRDVAFLQLRQMLNLPATQPMVLTTDLPTPPAPPAVPVRTAALPPTPNAAPNAAPGRAPVTNAAQTEGLLAVNAAEVLADDPRVASAIDSTLATSDTSARERAPTRQARENITVQRNLLRQARAQRLPQIALSSAYQRISYPSGGFVPFPSGLNQFFPNWTAAISVSLPIFAGGRIRGDELVAEAGLREAEQTAKQVEEFSTLDAQTAIAQLAQAEATWLASAGTAQQASRAYSISEVRYREGISTLVELSDSRLLLQQAQLNSVTAARDLQVARLKLALLKDLPLSTAGAASASRAGGSAAGASGSSGAAQGAQGAQGSSSSTTQRSAASAAGGTQQAGVAGGGIP